MTLDPRLYVAYLAAVCVAAFLLGEPWQVGALCGGQVVLALVARVPARRLLKRTRKLMLFVVVIGVSFALSPHDPETDRWVSLAGVPVNATGAQLGGVMVLRIVTIVLASQIVRSVDARAFTTGLQRFGMPKSIALSIDTVLALFTGGGGGGKGRGGGKAGAGADADAEREPLLRRIATTARRIVRGDVGALKRHVEQRIDDASRYVEEREGRAEAPVSARRLADVGVVAGTALAMMGIKAVKILPALPFAPGHKFVLLAPLYVIAAVRTRGRFGATAAGLTMGTVAFLMGDGKYGVFEIFKHVTPGLVCDLLIVVLRLQRTDAGRPEAPPMPRHAALWRWLVLCVTMAAGRFATIFVVVSLVQAPAIAYAFFAPGLALHLTFGVLGGIATHRIALHFGEPETTAPSDAAASASVRDAEEKAV